MITGEAEIVRSEHRGPPKSWEMFEGTIGLLCECLENASIPISIAHSDPGSTEGVSGHMVVTSSLHSAGRALCPSVGVVPNQRTGHPFLDSI